MKKSFFARMLMGAAVFAAALSASFASHASTGTEQPVYVAAVVAQSQPVLDTSIAMARIEATMTVHDVAPAESSCPTTESACTMEPAKSAMTSISADRLVSIRHSFGDSTATAAIYAKNLGDNSPA